jgi:16S rRNA (guanine527-N7)-methyltransferase
MDSKGQKGNWLRSLCALNRLPVSDTQLEQLEEYAGALRHWNQKVNLISRKDEEYVWDHHILHCMSVLFNVSILSTARVIDLGTGGGFPGIPIKILIPTLSMVLVDSVRKKTQAVADIVHQLSVKDVNVECSRAEQLGTRPGFHNEFDYIIARGVADLSKLVLWGFPLLKPRRAESPTPLQSRGKPFIKPPALIAMKGGDLSKEIQSARKSPDVREIEILELKVDGLEQVHNPDHKVVIVSFR